MDTWIFWFILAGLVLAAEMLTGTFYLLMISVGLVAGGLVALGGFDLNIQAVVAAVVWIIATLILRKTQWGKSQSTDSERDPNVNMDIGQNITVDVWASGRQTRVMHRGAMWDVELLKGEAVPGDYIIREVRGSRLFVEKL